MVDQLVLRGRVRRHGCLAVALLLGIAFTAVCLFSPRPALADDAPYLSAAPFIKALNGFRAYHGLPAGIVESVQATKGCAEHVNYMRYNGITHHQDSSAKGATDLGAQAGASSVITTMEFRLPDPEGAVRYWSPELRFPTTSIPTPVAAP